MILRLLPPDGVDGARHFPAWLAEQRVSLAFSTYQSGKLCLIGLQPDGRLSVFERMFNRASGFINASCARKRLRFEISVAHSPPLQALYEKR